MDVTLNTADLGETVEALGGDRIMRDRRFPETVRRQAGKNTARVKGE